MKPKHKRLGFVVVGVGLLMFATILILFALNDSVVFFYSPSGLVEKDVPPDRRLRLGCLVEDFLNICVQFFTFSKHVV